MAIATFLFKRNKQYEFAVFVEQTMNLPQNLWRIQNMFERVMADDNVDRVFRQGCWVRDEFNTPSSKFFSEKIGNIAGDSALAVQAGKIPSGAGPELENRVFRRNVRRDFL